MNFNLKPKRLKNLSPSKFSDIASRVKFLLDVTVVVAVVRKTIPRHNVTVSHVLIRMLLGNSCVPNLVSKGLFTDLYKFFFFFFYSFFGSYFFPSVVNPEITRIRNNS